MTFGSLAVVAVLFLGVGVVSLTVLKRLQSDLAAKNLSRIRGFEDALGYIASPDQVQREHDRIAGVMRRFRIGAVEIDLPDGKTIHLRLAGDHVHISE